MYRDHRKGPGGPPGGATHPGGPHGLKWEGNQPIVGWCAPLGPPPAPRVKTLGVGGRPTWLGGHSTPLAAAPPRRSHLLGPAHTLGGLYKGGREGSSTLKSWRLPLPCYTSPSRRSLAKPCRDPATSTTTPSCCWSHLPQPLLPPCWIKKEETSSAPYVC